MVNIKTKPDAEGARREEETAAPSLVSSSNNAMQANPSPPELEAEPQSPSAPVMGQSDSTPVKKFITKTSIPDSDSDTSPYGDETAKLAHAKENEDNDSDLSSLADRTPPPPTQELRNVETRHGQGRFNKFQVQCTHIGWCTCPAHASYPGVRVLHLSEWALSSMPVLTSALRTTLRLSDWDLAIEGPDVRLTASAVVGSLTRLASESDATWPTKRADAEELVKHAYVCFPPHQQLPGTESRVEQAQQVLGRWEADTDRDHVVLAGRLWEVVDGHPDLLSNLLPFFPESAAAGVREMWERKDWAREAGMREDLSKRGRK